MKLSGKVALITGGNTGIGEATAMLLAAEGAKVMIAARREKEGGEIVARIKSLGGDAQFVRSDVTVASDCKEMVTQTLAAFGRFDIAVNNAGIARGGRFVADEDEAGFAEVIAVNLIGMFHCMKYELPALLSNGGGSIINIASISGLISGPGQSAYTASKHGVLGLTKTAAIEYAAAGVRVNAVCPAATRTDMVNRWFKMPGVEQKVTAAIPAGRIAEPEEVAKAVLFLASNDASFITGHPLVIDGGFVAQ